MTAANTRRKIHPKLRMIAREPSAETAVRTGRSASLCMAGALDSAEPPTADDVLVNVFVHTTNGREIHADVNARNKVMRGQIQAMTLPLSQVRALAEGGNVTHLEAGEPLMSPRPTVNPGKAGPPDLDRTDFGLKAAHRFGEDILIGIIDVQGFDFAHPDFLTRNGETRWVAIWDQGAASGKPPEKTKDFDVDYGRELTAKEMNEALAASKRLKVPATALEPQSQMVPGSHGTHVASIAAGNSGVCRRARIAGVVISLPKEDSDRRKSFYDSTRIAHAVDYLIELSKKLAEQEGRKIPLSINVSLGTNGHAHDASAAISRWLDNAMNTPGRSISVAAGNAGQEKAAFEGDLGYVMGRIHTSGRISSRGLGTDIDWMVVGDGRSDVSENELEIWYSAQDRFKVQLRPPGGEWTEEVEPGQFIERRALSDGTSISIYNEIYHPSNGANYISIYLTPSPDELRGVASGQWTVRITAEEVRDGRYHGWIERDDPRPLGRSGTREMWRFPSFFSERSNVDESTVSSLACGMRVLSVANLDFARERINVTSSQGPTRDGRFKPDVAAPGTDIVAAKGFAGPDDLWISMSGTSMASPYVCGVAGLMMAIENTLTAAQIEGIIQATARPLPGASYSWLNDAGFGRINPKKCLQEAATVNDRKGL
jgi:subtilisin family serine protease